MGEFRVVVDQTGKQPAPLSKAALEGTGVICAAD